MHGVFFTILGSVGFALARVGWQSDAPGRQRTWDDPKTTLEDDRLGRRSLAQKIAGVITSNVEPRPTRIAIYGPWGSGKTTFLTFLAQELRKKAAVVTFNPWHYRTRDAAWQGFIDVVESALAQDVGDWANHDFMVRRWSKNIMQVARAGWAPRTDVGKKLADLVFERVGGALEDRKQQLATSLEMYLGRGRRMVILVDDMDRVDPRLAVDILSAVKEFLDLPQVTFVIAVDIDALSTAISSVHQGLGTQGGRRYLEKIIHWPLELAIRNAKSLLDDPELIGAIRHLHRPSLELISSYLPGNPRQLKRYLWTLAVQYPDALYEHKPDYPVLYLAKLMHLQHPSALRKIVKTDSLVQALGLSGKLLLAGNEAEREEQLKKYRYLLMEAPPAIEATEADDVWSLFLGLLKHSGDESHRELNLALLGDDDVSLKMPLETLVAGWKKTDPATRIRELTSSLTVSGVALEVSWKEFFTQVARMRTAALGDAADAPVEHDVIRLISEAQDAGCLLQDLLDMAAEQSEPTRFLDAEAYHELYLCCTKFANFRKPAYYAPLRDQEERLMNRATQLVADKPAPYLRVLRMDDHPAASEQEVQAQSLRNIVLDILLSQRADEIITAFRRPGAILPLMTDKEFGWDRWLLLSDNRWLHAPSRRRQLLTILEEGAQNPVILENLYQYFSFVSSTYIRATIIDDSEFVLDLWRYLTAGRLNYRHVGSLLEDKSSLESRWGAKVVLPVPDDPIWKDR